MLTLSGDTNLEQLEDKRHIGCYEGCDRHTSSTVMGYVTSVCGYVAAALTGIDHEYRCQTRQGCVDTGFVTWWSVHQATAAWDTLASASSGLLKQ